MPFRRTKSVTRRPRSTYAQRKVVRVSHSAANYKVPRSVRAFRGEHVIRKLRFALNEGAYHTMLSTSGGVSSDWVYRANDLFDPYVGAGGQQPRCFDQLMTMYRNFAVLGSKIVYSIGYSIGSSTSNDMIVATVLGDFATAPANTQDIMEHPRRHYKMLTANQDKLTMVRKYSWKINGSKDIMDNDDLWGSASGTPSKQWNYHIQAWCPGGNTDSAYVMGYIDYCVIFFHPIQPTAS